MPQQDAESRFIIPRPKAQPIAPVGRWTRSSIAYDIRNERRVYLKDSWRVSVKGIEAEGEIYRRLHEKEVPNIPPCLLAGDIGDFHHRTRTHDHVTDKKGAHSYWNLTPHRHYRIVLGVVGRRLEKFDHSKELVSAMHAALKGRWPFS